MRRFVILFVILVVGSISCFSQSNQLAFNEAANFYIQGKLDKAKERVEDGLRKDPNNPRLRALYEKLKKEEQEKKEQEKKDQEEQQKQQQQQNQNQQNQNQQNQQQQDQQNQDQRSKQDQSQEKSGDKEKKENKDGKGEKNEKDKKEGENNENEPENKEGKDDKKEKPGFGEGKELDEKEQEKLRKEQVANKLKQLNLSEEKARMILEAMRSNEVQYLQQRKRRPVYVPDKSKPDW